MQDKPGFWLSRFSEKCTEELMATSEVTIQNNAIIHDYCAIKTRPLYNGKRLT